MIDLFAIREHIEKSANRGNSIKLPHAIAVELVERCQMLEAELVKARELLSGKRSEGYINVTDENLETLWLAAGGDFHGPNVETGSMEQQRLFNFMRKLILLKSGQGYPDWSCPNKPLPLNTENAALVFSSRTDWRDAFKHGVEWVLHNQFEEVGFITRKNTTSSIGTYAGSLSIHRYDTQIHPDIDLKRNQKLYVRKGEST